MQQLEVQGRTFSERVPWQMGAHAREDAGYETTVPRVNIPRK